MPAMKRLPTAVPGLDQLLHGGLFEGGVYIFEGPPGVGKTTLGNQIAFGHAAQGGKALYVTMLAESHSRMLQHMLNQSFCKPELVNDTVLYVSAYRELEQHGLKEVVQLLRGEINRHQISLLVVDGLVVENRAVHSEETVRQFVHELQTLASAMGCTCLLLTSGNGRVLNAEQTMVDGIFAFEDHGYQWRNERRIQVRKFRGSAVERGKHTFCITDHGLRFFPRLEGTPPTPERDGVPDGAVSTGVPGLDQVLQLGGLARGSSTLLTGAGGTGKTTLALAFAAAATASEAGLVLAGAETPAELRRTGRTLLPSLDKALAAGALHLEAQGQEDEALDVIGHKLLRWVDARRVRRLVIDGLASLADTVAFPERGYRFVGRLLREFKVRGVTSIVTVDPAALATATARDFNQEGLSPWFDNALDLSLVGGRHDVRQLTLRKLRGTRASRASLDLALDGSGLTVT
jgi:circadian clock protein KaiC